MRFQEKIVYSHWQMVFLTVSGTLFSGVFLNDYLLKIGFDEYHFGLLYSLSYLAGFVAFPISFYANFVLRKRRFYLTFNSAAVSLYLFFIVAPYVPLLGGEAIIRISIASLGGSTILSGIAGIVLYPWLYRVVGEDRWGPFFTRRLATNMAISILCTLSLGRMLSGGSLTVSTTLFAAGLAAGVLYLLFSRLIPEYRGGEEAGADAPDRLPVILRHMAGDRGYIGLLLHTAMFAVGLGLFTPFVYPYLLSEVGIDAGRVSLFQAIMMCACLLSLLFASRLTAKIGNLRVLFVFASVAWAIPLMLLFVPHAPFVLSCAVFVMGIAEGNGVVLIMMFTAFINLLFAYSPTRNQVLYLSVIGFVKAICLAVGSYIGGVLSRGGRNWELLGDEISGYVLVFVSAAACLLFSYALLLYYKPLFTAKVK